MDKTVKHRYHPLLLQYHSTNPNQPYKRDSHTGWTTLHPEKPPTEQRVIMEKAKGDQQRVIMKKANTQENNRGA